MKKNIIIIILLVMSIGLSIGLFITHKELSNQKEDFKDEIKELEEKINKYEKEDSLSNENYAPSETIEDYGLTQITYKKFKNMIKNKETFIILFTQPGCSHCISFKPTIKEIIEEDEITIYELDITTLSEDEWYELQEIISVSGTPTLATVKDGVNSNTLVGNRDTETVLKFLMDEEFIN